LIFSTFRHIYLLENIHHEKAVNPDFVTFSDGLHDAPSKNVEDICSTFRGKEDWYDGAKNSFEKWGVPISVQMAIMNQESHFVADA
jgi:hypothetical protein